MRAAKSKHTFRVGEHEVKFSGDFDSGNLKNVIQHQSFRYQIQASLDSYQIPCSSKSFFHFSVEGLPDGPHVIFELNNLAMLNCLKDDAIKYRPFWSTDGVKYQRLLDSNIKISIYNQNVSLKITIPSRTKKTFFSFSLPYSYQRYIDLVRSLPSSNEHMYIHKQVLCYSPNLNLVYSISITSHHKCTQQDETIGQLSNVVLLPQRHITIPKKKFTKPVILMSGRVHPGQSPSSWALQGIIKFLISDESQAKILRQNFQIVIVPMLNPDGVQEGLYRLDPKGHNLNRYYLIGDNRQPSVYAMKHLIKHYHTTNRLLYYLDFHSHPNFKGTFLYGNALDQFPYQVQTQLFSRILSMQSKSFEQNYCIFDKSQMTSKDRHDLYTKQGCARVFAHKISQILHSYTIQLGFHAPSTSKNSFFDQQSYFKQGRNIMKAILVTSGLLQDKKINLKIIRSNLSQQIYNRQQRFKKQDRFINSKIQKVNEIIQNQYWKPIKQLHFAIKARPSLRISSKRKTRILHKTPQSHGSISTVDRQDVQSHQFFIQNKIKYQTTTITFNINNNPQKIYHSKSITKNTNYPQTYVPPISKPPHNLGGIRQKLKKIRKTRQLASMQILHEQNVFGDIKIRQQGQNDIKQNKIHSLFLSTKK